MIFDTAIFYCNKGLYLKDIPNLKKKQVVVKSEIHLYNKNYVDIAINLN